MNLINLHQGTSYLCFLNICTYTKGQGAGWGVGDTGWWWGSGKGKAPDFLPDFFAKSYDLPLIEFSLEENVEVYNYCVCNSHKSALAYSGIDN